MIEETTTRPNGFCVLISEIKKILKSDRDFLLVISGATGEGKSSLAQQIATEVAPSFDPESHTVFTRAEFVNMLKNPDLLPKYGAAVVDEAVNVLFRRDFASKGQKELLRLLDMVRDRNLLMVLCLPSFWSLDRHILQSRVRGWVFVAQRGDGYVFKPDSNPFVEDPWHRRLNEKKCLDWNQGYTPKDSKNYIGRISYPDLSPAKREEYLRIKAKKKRDAEKYDLDPREQARKQKEEEKYAIGMLGQLYEGGFIPKEKMKTLAPQFAKSVGGFMRRYQRLKGEDA